MKILSSVQVQQTDQFTIKNEPIVSIDLMERASKAFSKKFLELYPESKTILVLCGIGNNGGDGLVIARLLNSKNKRVRVFTIGNLDKRSPDFKTNLDRLPKEVVNSHLQSSGDFPAIDSENDHIVDGLFGSGLSRPIEGLYAELISHLNASKATIVSIDNASGLFADKPTEGEVIIQPKHTISFQTPKLTFFMPSLFPYIGEWHVVDIGLNQDFIDKLESDFSFAEPEEMKLLIPKRKKFNHKGEAGRLLIVAGSKGKMGAAILATKAAFRTGAGLVHVHSPACGLDILQISIPEAMVMVDEEDELISNINAPENINAIAIGPGIGTDEKTAKALYQLILNSSNPLILDADALNILADHPDWLDELPENTILTPHPGEFKRLVGEWTDDFNKLEKLKFLCKRYKLNVVLKGANSAVCNKNGNVFFNSTGNPGMATAGSGDVLTGIIGALLAQGLSPFDSVRLGVYLHGCAGDLGVEKFGELSMKASDITANLPHAISLKKIL